MKKLIFVVLVFVFLLPFVFAEETECMTKEDVEAEREACLYIYENSVYSVGGYGSRHFEHDCGEDVTEVMRGTHTGDPEKYFGETYKADLCGFYIPKDLADFLTYGLMGLVIVAIFAAAFYFLRPHRK
ncbi:MAG: hypothetical protein ABID38_04195 [Candidatus Diapherotrites archaeon]